MSQAYQGSCFCGSIKIEATGEPVAMAYCHCSSCRSWTGSVVGASTMWPIDAIRITAGAEHLVTFRKTPNTVSHRQHCRRCGGNVMIHHPAFGLYDVCASTLPTLKFAPTSHVNYGETVFPMKDGLTKYRGFPKEFGGTGEEIPE